MMMGRRSPIFSANRAKDRLPDAHGEGFWIAMANENSEPEPARIFLPVGFETHPKGMRARQADALMINTRRSAYCG